MDLEIHFLYPNQVIVRELETDCQNCFYRIILQEMQPRANSDSEKKQKASTLVGWLSCRLICINLSHIQYALTLPWHIWAKQRVVAADDVDPKHSLLNIWLHKKVAIVYRWDLRSWRQEGKSATMGEEYFYGLLIGQGFSWLRSRPSHLTEEERNRVMILNLWSHDLYNLSTRTNSPPLQLRGRTMSVPNHYQMQCAPETTKSQRKERTQVETAQISRQQSRIDAKSFSFPINRGLRLDAKVVQSY